jgi:hypothetical protein
LDDGVDWFNPEKLNLKVIVHDVKTDRYKLRNSKQDEGEVVMRRHKRVARKSLGWQRHEYKLFTEEILHRQNVDGSKTTLSRRMLNPWPTLVHFFRPRPVGATTTSSRYHLAASSSSSPKAPISSSLTGRSSVNMPTATSSNSNGEDLIDADPGDNSEYQRVTKRQKTGVYTSRDTGFVNESDSESGSVASSSRTSNSRVSGSTGFLSLNDPLFRGDLAPIINVRTTLHTKLITEEVEEGLPYMSSEMSLTTVEPGGIHQDPLTSIDHTSDNWNKRASVKSDFGEGANMLISDEHGHGAMLGVHTMDGIEGEGVWSGLQLSRSSSLMTPSKMQGDGLTMAHGLESAVDGTEEALGPGIFITHYAPDSSFCGEESQVLIVLSPETIPLVSFSCFVDGIECDTTVVVPGSVLRVIVPRHDSGVFPLWIVGKDAHGNVATHSESLPFYFLPSANEGVLTLAHASSLDYFTNAVFYKFRHTTRKLDLTGNSLVNLDFLSGFEELRELVLDHNALSQHTRFPHLPKLTSLSVNHNHISQIDLFITHLVEAQIKKLKFLSILGNVANPSFDRLEHRYYNFRIYIISKLQTLRILDSRDVTEDERKHSAAIAEEAEIELELVEMDQNGQQNTVYQSQNAPNPASISHHLDSFGGISTSNVGDFLYSSSDAAYAASPPVRSPSGGVLFDATHL